MNQKITVGINGFGRIGRNLFKLLLNHPTIEVVSINDLADAKTLAHLLKYDSIHGVMKESVSSAENAILVDNRRFSFSSTEKITDLNWSQVDVVIECTGRFKTRAELENHFKNGAKKRILSVPPADDSTKTIVLDVNESSIKPEDTIISNASCTTNNAAHMLKFIDDLCGEEQAYSTTVHSYTTDQSLHDQPLRD